VKLPDGTTAREYPPLRHPRSHPLGTDRIGNDVLYSSLKGVRTALLIGGLTTLIVIPFALLFGMPAGYFGGRVDDAVQYVYTTLASIPDILLITAFMLIAGRGLLPLCVILGITSWTGLCRLLRGETLKLREMEYVQAARALGLSPLRIMTRHIVPNLMHIVLISSVLRFSALVLTEAVLSYLGLGVDPGTGSWGHMINMTRLELCREPLVWWNFAAAFTFMFGLVLPVNVFGDALRDALDPRLKTR
jgi:peptide/nickel transport system permease protein